MKIVNMKMKDMTSKEAIHDVFMRDLALPDDYGRNLDALYDCLTSMHDMVIFRLDFEGTSYEELIPYAQRTILCLVDACMANVLMEIRIK